MIWVFAGRIAEFNVRGPWIAKAFATAAQTQCPGLSAGAREGVGAAPLPLCPFTHGARRATALKLVQHTKQQIREKP